MKPSELFNNVENVKGVLTETFIGAKTNCHIDETDLLFRYFESLLRMADTQEKRNILFESLSDTFELKLK